MTTEKAIKTKTFLSVKKFIIYLVIVLIGLYLKLTGSSGNTIILLGIGLLYGHLIFRSIMFEMNQFIKTGIILLSTAVIFIIVLENFNVIRAPIMILVATGISLIIEWITK